MTFSDHLEPLCTHTTKGVAQRAQQVDDCGGAVRVAAPRCERVSVMMMMQGHRCELSVCARSTLPVATLKVKT